MNQTSCIILHTSLAHWASFLESVSAGPRIILRDVYSNVTFELLKNIQLGISKQLMNCMVTYLSSEEILYNPHKPESEWRNLFLLRTELFQAIHTILSNIKTKYGEPRLHDDFSSKSSSELNDIFTNDGPKNALKERVTVPSHVICFHSGLLYRSTGYERESRLKRIYLCSQTLSILCA